MIFTLFLISAFALPSFETMNVCTIGGETKTSFDTCAGAATLPDCLTECKAACTGDITAAKKDVCEAAIPCWNGDAAVHAEITGKAACVKAHGTGADARCGANCKIFCDVAENLVAERTECLAAMPCYDVADTAKVTACDTWCKAGTNKAVTGTHCETKLPCLQATKTLPQACPLAGTNVDCFTQCETGCKGAVDNTNTAVCEANLPCFNGTSHVYITGKDACTNASAESAKPKCIPNCIGFCDVKENYDAAGNKAICDTAVPCYSLADDAAVTKCKAICSDGGAPLLDFCTKKLPCTPEYGTAACSDFMTKGTAGCTFAQCDAFCKAAGHSALPDCTSGKPAKCNTEPCKHKIPATGTPTAEQYCAAALCTAYCSADPCSTAKKPDCGTECTAWCALDANKEDALCKPDGGALSVAVSIFLLLVALL